MGDKGADSVDEKLRANAEERFLESLRWAKRAAKLGLVREDQAVDAAILRAAVLAEEEAGLRPRSKRLPRHRAARAMERIREQVRRSKARCPDGTRPVTLWDDDE